jgi:hypothetical protein
VRLIFTFFCRKNPLMLVLMLMIAWTMRVLQQVLLLILQRMVYFIVILIPWYFVKSTTFDLEILCCSLLTKLRFHNFSFTEWLWIGWCTHIWCGIFFKKKLQNPFFKMQYFMPFEAFQICDCSVYVLLFITISFPLQLSSTACSLKYKILVWDLFVLFYKFRFKLSIRLSISLQKHPHLFYLWEI